VAWRRKESAMPDSRGTDDRIKRLTSAFRNDGFAVSGEDVHRFRESVGLLARHQTATNYENGEAKRAYYVEGTPYEMGYLLGLMAEPEVRRMATQYVDRAVRALIREAISGERRDYTGPRGPILISLHRVLVDTIYEMIRSEHILADVPIPVHEEIRGLVAGCRAAARRRNETSTVTEEELWVLNAGLDCILPRVYTGDLLRARIPGLMAKDLQIPISCNAFAILNGAAADGAIFGRDFMFPTGGVFQDSAALVIQNPRSKGLRAVVPFVSMTAPGIVGSVAAMNLHGIAAGVHVAAGANCNPARPGINSLLLVRDAIEHSRSADEAVQCMVDAPRGVTWTYMIAASAASGDRACVVEAGASADHVSFADFPGPRMRSLLPDAEFLDQHRSTELRSGAMVRWEGFPEPTDYVRRFNPRLWRAFRKTLRQGAFSPRGAINRGPKERNCPGAMYFSPLRGRLHEVVLLTNHFVVPEMRLCSMHPWTQRVARGMIDDSQWRYDELNRRVLDSLEKNGPITLSEARRIIDFLSPSGDYPSYYRNNPRSADGKAVSIFGSTNLFDLGSRIVESHYGYYADDWVRITLPRYV
jgi:hypothetical protein